MPHDKSTMLMEDGTLQRLGEIITTHVPSGTVHNPQVSLVDLVVNKKETNVQSTCALASTAPAILSQQDS